MDMGDRIREESVAGMKYLVRGLFALVVCLAANYPLISYYTGGGVWAVLVVLLFLGINVVPSMENRTMPLKRHRICADGCELLILFLISCGVSVEGMLLVLPKFIAGSFVTWGLNLVTVLVVENIVFWNGIIRVYTTSAQIGLKWRVIGILCGWVPVVNLVVLWKIIGIAYEEAGFESGKILHTASLEGEKRCRTKYPLLMVHGVFFRDFKYFNYWGRVPGELQKHGAVIYYGNHQSAASVEDSAVELAERIRQIVEETGCEKLNIIAHSKGGLDCRYAISCLGMDQYAASLTTINTPHRGCIFADYLLNVVPRALKEKVADGYNVALNKLGDKSPDFIAAVTDLTASACEAFNEKAPDMPGVYYQSVGSKLNHASDGRFPLNFSHQLVKYFDGPNDGLVAETSFPWGDHFELLTTPGKRGISHGDMIDLNRENIREFDVRDFYVNLVSKLREDGF